MNDKERKLLIWVMLGAGVILALLYSPIGSPENYVSDGYMNGANGVDFRGQFQNVRYASSLNSQPSMSPTIGLTTSSPQSAGALDNNNISVVNIDTRNPENPAQSKPSIQYKVGQQENSEISNNASYSVQISDNPFSNQSQGNSGAIGIAEPTSVFVKNNSKNNNRSVNPDFIAVNLDLTVFSDLNRQGLGPGLNNITDPGEDPTGPPIPVPDGLWFLLTMALSYVLWISVLKNKLKKSEN